jgi:hypothetical protein
MGTYLSGLVCLILFLFFWNISDPFWAGIFRFASFMFFALAVLGLLKLMNGPLTVTLSSSSNHLEVIYQKKDEAIHQDHFDRSTITNVVAIKGEQDIINHYLQPDLVAMKLNFSDSDRDMFLFEFGGRPRFFDPDAIRQVKNFLEDEGIELEVKSLILP